MRISQRNILTEEALRKTLTKNSFLKFYFLPDNAESFMYEVHHFPQRSDNTLFLFEPEKKEVAENAAQYYSAQTVFPETQETSGRMGRLFTELGDLELLQAELNWIDAEGMPYKKRITIRTDMEKRDILKANKLWSFILD